MANERKKMLEKFCNESKTLSEAFEKMKEYDEKNGAKKIVINTNCPEDGKFVEEHFKK